MQGAERNTWQKQAVYDALVTLGHPSATEVYKYVHETSPNLSRGTVFRVLSSFAESGRAKKLCFHESDVRFDATLSPHAHARCRVCGKIYDVMIDPAPLVFGAEQAGFQVESCETELVGVCASCTNK